MRRAQEHMWSAVPAEIKDRLSLLGSEIRGVKIASDLPLEWLPVNGIPLQLQHECSRIPLTPASLAFGAATDTDPILLAPQDLTKVLIVRSYDHDDPIRETLEVEIRRGLHQRGKLDIEIQIRDVASPAELVEAINSHDGAIVVFDCHGQFSSDSFVASIVVGGEPVRLWEIRKQIRRMPPIVLMSCCDTLPVDGSHASAADGMLLFGAKTVVATLLPIDATRAAVFVARLLWRLAEFVPIALGMRRSLTWREIMSGLIKMAHVTEILLWFVEHRIVDPMH